jgi:hypothetical protein
MITTTQVIERVRELKLLKFTAESGLLEALEAKGLTLSKVEKLLPLVDNLGLLPLLVKNKNLVLSIAPLAIEPATALLPILVGLLRNPSSVLLPGAGLVALGGFATVSDSGLIGIPLVLLGAPLIALGSILGGEISVPAVSASIETSAPASSRPSVKASAPRVSAAPKVSAGPKTAARAPTAASTKNGQRKTIKIR